ncbi:hypothetical protein LOTGIDRAFT_165343 [Lottia gigantea]|uniref:DNA-directed DNA polymerase n=1 Tax=Lottia gigantea TaxID=225164 RepID=V4A0V5_LOTGI|nr:hypothetical protein LOTGIDRAFT_165343 [Lottia gigantea]ESO88560.1 hypothetical protein LOTGIDRAFT_165343 [Lottia gigantea]
MCFAQLKLNVFSTISDNCLYAWDCESYCEKETNKAIPYCCTLVNLEKLRKRLDDYNNYISDLSDTLDFKPADPISEEYYNILMTNIVEIFLGTDCIDQMLQRLGKVDEKRLTLISHNGSGFDNWIALQSVKKLTQCPLVVDNKILSLPLSNPYTEERLQKKWKRQKEMMSNSNYLQNISFTCSFKHQSTSLAAWGNSSNLPMNLRKITDINIAKFTKETWESLRPEWETYAKRDTLCLGACLIKYNQAMKITVFQNVSNNLTAPSLSLKGWYYLYHYNKEMVEKPYYERTILVPKHTEKENVEKVYSHTHPFIRHFIRQSIKGGRVSANRKSFETDKMNEICTILKEYNESDTEGIINLFKEYSVNPKDKTEVHAKLKKLDYSKLVAFDANGLYASAMTEGEYPKAESARPVRLEENEKFVKLFNEQKFRPRTAILIVWFKYPTNMFFQPIPAKDKITFTNRIGKKETGSKIRFRNGFCHDVSTSVDIQEIVKAGGKIIKILDGIVYEENFKTPPYRDYILILKELRNKYKKEGDMVVSNCMKLLGNSLYDGFYKPEIYYTDTDSLYISSSNWDKLNEAGLVSENEYSKGKNDYGDGGIIFGLYLAPKVKYNIILTSEGVLKEIKTFKGYSNYKIKVEDYIQLASGHDVTNEFDKPWVKSFTDGIVIPNDKQKKVFRSYLNLVKRKAPNSEGIMYPYNNKDEMCLDDDYVSDDFDYFTNVSNDDPSE